MRRFGDLARDTRIGARISLRRLADELGLSAAYVSDIERGNRNPPSTEVIRKWAGIVSGDEAEFVRTAKHDRPAVELPINRRLANAPEAAYMLQRDWPDFTEEDYEAMMEFIRSRRGGKEDD